MRGNQRRRVYQDVDLAVLVIAIYLISHDINSDDRIERACLNRPQPAGFGNLVTGITGAVTVITAIRRGRLCCSSWGVEDAVPVGIFKALSRIRERILGRFWQSSKGP